MTEIEAELPRVDDKDAVERAKTSPALQAALDMSRPRNWWGTGIPPTRLLKMAHDDGIPVAWVPQQDILVELDSAATRDARLAILQGHRARILEHCGILAAECGDPWIADEQALVQRAILALGAGHHEAAMALAVSVGEPLAVWASTPRVKLFLSTTEREDWEKKRHKTSKYLWAKEEIGSLPAAIHNDDVLRTALIAPIVGFFKPFRVENGDPIPGALSRHVVAHRATRAHFSEVNSLLAVMLVSSVLREMQSWSEEVRFMDNPDE